MISTCRADLLAQETIKKMGLKNTEREISIKNKKEKQFIFWVTINQEKNIWIAGEIFTNSDGIIINFYHNQAFHEKGKNYGEILKDIEVKITKINNSLDLKKNGKNILRFLIRQKNEIPIYLGIESIITIDYNMNEENFQKEFWKKLQEIIDIIKKKWPYDLLE